MHSRRSVERVRALCRAGSSTREIARISWIPERTVAHRREGDRRADLDAPRRSADCPRCAGRGLDASYAYLLGAHLGDGHRRLARNTARGAARHVRGAAIGVRPRREAHGLRRREELHEALGLPLPPARPRHEHTRPIVLEPRQQELVDRHTAAFLRGLFDSDDCRVTNWATHTVDGKTTRREYLRWFFSNESSDILGLCSAGLDRLGFPPRHDTVSVARKKAVAALDAAVEPKA